MGKEAAEMGTPSEAEGAERYLGSRSRAVRQQAQGWAVDAGGSGKFSRCKDDTRTEDKGENRVQKEQCCSV